MFDDDDSLDPSRFHPDQEGSIQMKRESRVINWAIELKHPTGIRRSSRWRVATMRYYLMNEAIDCKKITGNRRLQRRGRVEDRENDNQRRGRDLNM
jgi:hypothetical protein